MNLIRERGDARYYADDKVEWEGALFPSRNKELIRSLNTGFNAFDNDPWILHLVDFVKEVLAQDRVKVVGVCYGHQIVGRALGAKVARSESGAWEVSVCQVVQTEKGKELFGGKDVLVSRVEWVDGLSLLFSFLLFSS